ncbi:peptidyl-prolyl cis-trans isomerase D [Roseateles sp. YR242]|uniref:peptidylprolyl isomerase n=1 Tax=Roseateles sp. YR242 TaxID=1855305 RepID=UPI0008C42802|nr:peptidylprolyl isomerase [Roseateles sp. YR242]SEL17225.1 peptidyl-prolyl cis-trans isomerase D [Roseateles sp. YR242]
MFDFVRKHTRLFQFLLLILILPSFVLLGVEGYSRFMDGNNAAVATVGDRQITQAEWDAAQRDQQERMRQQSPNVDPKLFDTPEMRKNILENVLRERVMDVAVEKERRSLTDQQVHEIIRTDPQFAFLFDPSGGFKKEMLAAMGLTADGLFQRVRQGALSNQVLGPIATSALPTESSASLAFDAFLQQREVQFQRFDVKDFAATLKPTDADLEAFYKDTKISARFQQAETADIEYVVLDQGSLTANLTVNPTDVAEYYKQNANNYKAPEERRASHILVKLTPDMSAADKAKAKAKAEALLAEARKNPAGFAELAKKNSDDSGSAVRGGDLDFFGEGAMVKPFQDATFKLKEGEISDLVESEFGYHIIKLTAIRGGKVPALEEVRGQIEAALRKDMAQKRYTEIADEFGNTVYEQSDSLKPAADKFKLTIQKATVQRKPAADATGVLASTKLLDAVFSNDSLNNKRNTQAVETGSSQLVSARVVAHHPARVPDLADVKPAVTAAWVQQHATEAATKAGQARLAELQKGGDAKGLGEVITVSRAKPGGLPGKALDQVLRTDASKLPAYAGVDTGDGQYLVVRINKLLPRDPALIDPKRASDQYAQTWAAAEMMSFYGALKTQYKAAIKPAVLKSLAAPDAASAAAH